MTLAKTDGCEQQVHLVEGRVETPGKWGECPMKPASLPVTKTLFGVGGPLSGLDLDDQDPVVSSKDEIQFDAADPEVATQQLETMLLQVVDDEGLSQPSLATGWAA